MKVIKDTETLEIFHVMVQIVGKRGSCLQSEQCCNEYQTTNMIILLNFKFLFYQNVQLEHYHEPIE